MNRIALILCLALITPILPHSHTVPAASHGQRPHTRVCNKDGTLCVKPAFPDSLVQNPLYFEVRVNSPDLVELGWELRDDSGQVLDHDPDGRLSFLVNKVSASERTLAVRDFTLAPARSNRGMLVLHATAGSIGSEPYALPELSIPVRLDPRTTSVTYAVPAGGEFSEALTDSVESDAIPDVPMQARVEWRTTTLLFVRPTALDGAAAEAAARAYGGQGPWHVINFRKAHGTAHLTIMGDGWAGVSYYLTGLRFLLEKTTEHQPGVRRVIFDRQPDFGQ